jgi:hypothetical protein
MARRQGAAVDGDARRLDRLYLGVYVAYVTLGMIGRWSGWQNGDQLWFVDAARHVLDGSWRLYEFSPAFAVPVAPPRGIVYSYTPLLALVLAPVVALADALRGTPLAASVGGGDELAYRLIALPLLVADTLAMDQLRRLVHEWRPRVDEAGLLLGVVVTLFLTGLIQVSASHNHHEGLVLFLLLATLRATPRSVVWGGLLAGLTLAAKQTAVLPLLPVGLALLGTGPPRRALRGALVWGALAGAVFGAFLLPPLLVNAGAVIYGVWTLAGRLPLYGPGLPGWIDQGLAQAFGTQSPAYALWHARLVEYSNAILLGAGALAPAGAIWWAARRGQAISLRDSRLLALVAFGASLQLVLSKWIGSHYYQAPLALALAWDVVRVAPRPPFLGAGAGFAFRLITLALPIPGLPIPRSGAILALFAGLCGLTLGAALAPPQPAPGAPEPGPAPAHAVPTDP